MLVQPIVAIGEGSVSLQPGTTVPSLRAGQLGELTMSEMQARYYEQAYRKRTFFAANQAAQAVSVALATTYTGICLSNPIGSPVNLVLKKFNYALTVAPAAIASLGLIVGFASGGVSAHTTALVPQSTLIGTGPNPYAKVDSACTLVGTPTWAMQFQSGFTAATLPSAGPGVTDAEGSFIIPPGAYIAIGALTAITGLGSLMWDEVPL